MTKKFIFSEKNSLDLFSLLLFFNTNFFHLVLNRKYFFSYENTIQKVKHFYDMSEKKNTLCSAFTQFHTNVFNFFENLLHFFFSMKNKNSLGSAHRISFSGCVFKENIFLHFSLRNSEKVRKKIFTLIFFYSVPHIIFSVTDFLRENITFHSVSHTELFYQEKKNSLRKTKKTNTFSL